VDGACISLARSDSPHGYIHTFRIQQPAALTPISSGKKYTAKRKQKLAELRSAKAKRIREFNSKTKKMPAAERKRRRSEFKKNVNAQFKNIVSKFPTARGITSVAQLQRLIKQAESIRA